MIQPIDSTNPARLPVASGRGNPGPHGCRSVDRPYVERGGPCEFVTSGDDWVEEAVLVTPLPGNGVEPLSVSRRPPIQSMLGVVIGPASGAEPGHGSSSELASDYRGNGLLSVFDSGDLLDVLAAELTANGPDQGWTWVDVGGRGGGAIPAI